jgi:MarR family transcriptional regulator for hemolysin
METEGLVTRQRDPRNRRVHQVDLTDQGRKAFGALRGTVQSFDEQLRNGFSDDELATLRHLLVRLAANAAAPTSHPSTPDTNEPA